MSARGSWNKSKANSDRSQPYSHCAGPIDDYLDVALQNCNNLSSYDVGHELFIQGYFEERRTPEIKRIVLAIFVLFSFHSKSPADTLDTVRAQKILRWGGDREGGGPFIYRAPDNLNKNLGFEVDLMAVLANRLKVQAQFSQGEWETLPEQLRRGDIDMVVNGYELTPAHLATMIATIPYYIYELQLLARANDASIQSWTDLAKPSPRRKKVGVMGGTAAALYVQTHYGSAVDVVHYKGSTDAMLEVENEKLDATVQDLPVALFYRDRYLGLRFVDRPAGRGYYVMYLRPEDRRLRDALNIELQLLILDGEIQRIYQRYGIWSETQGQLLAYTPLRPVLSLTSVNPLLPFPANMPWPAFSELADPNATQPATQAHGWLIIQRALPILLKSAGVTVLLSVLSMPLAILLGLFVALGRLFGPAPVRFVLAGYVELLRGTPLMLQLYAIYFVLPSFGIRIPAWPAAILGLAINYSAYEAEIYRAGLLAIPIGQMEAALALGMTKIQALRRVIVPQAVRLVVPPVTNDFIALFKDTSVCSVITVVELTKNYYELANSTGAYMELATLTAILYLLMSYPLSLLARKLERRRQHVIG